MDLITYAAVKKYVDKSLAEAGAVKGEKGDDGLTPFIGDNGNWWIGSTDTGVSARPDNLDIDGTLQVDVDNNKLSVVKDGVEKIFEFGDKTRGIDIDRINKLFVEGE